MMTGAMQQRLINRSFPVPTREAVPRGMGYLSARILGYHLLSFLEDKVWNPVVIIVCLKRGRCCIHFLNVFFSLSKNLPIINIPSGETNFIVASMIL